jgi:hypothetical protein
VTHRQPSCRKHLLQWSPRVTSCDAASNDLRGLELVNFGFSAFLKLLSLNEKPYKTEVRRRVGPSTGSGYDYHRSFRLLARRFLVENVAIAEILASAEKITRSSERQSALGALQRLETWRAAHPGRIVAVPPAIFESPAHLFRVKFEADFGLHARGRTTAIHLWNTMRPPLSADATYAAITLAAQAFDSLDDAPGDLGVLSMREPSRLYRLSDVGDQSALAASIVERLEETIRGTIRPLPSPEHRPPPPIS